MKKFLEWFFGMALLIASLFGIPVGGGYLSEYLGYDFDIWLFGWLMLLMCILTGVITWENEDDEPMQYKVQVGDKEFECNDVSHEEDLKTTILIMDGVESRVNFDTNILISGK